MSFHKLNGDGTVTDNLTGLVWLKDSNCYFTQYAQAPNGNSGLKWQQALDFVSGINKGSYPKCGLGYADWRLPNRQEMLSLIDYSRFKPALPAGNPFTSAGTGGTAYWTSTSYPSNLKWAWNIDTTWGVVRCVESSDDNGGDYHDRRSDL